MSTTELHPADLRAAAGTVRAVARDVAAATATALAAIARAGGPDHLPGPRTVSLPRTTGPAVVAAAVTGPVRGAGEGVADAVRTLATALDDTAEAMAALDLRLARTTS